MEEDKVVRLVIIAIASNLSAFSAGTCLGWTSPIGAKLKSADVSGSPLDKHISATEDACISSSLSLAAFLSPYAAGNLCNRIGPKWVQLSSSIFFIVAFLLMLVANKVWIILLGRLFQGVGVGFVMTAQPIYVGEISTDNARGALGSLMNLFIVTGILYVYAIGPFVSYSALQYYCLAVPIIFDVIFIFMPESPYFYVTKMKNINALKSLTFLRGKSESTVEEELMQIQANVEKAMANKSPIADIFRVSANLKALIITGGLIIFQQLSGVDVIVFNSQSIFEIAQANVDSATSNIIFGIVQVFAAILTPIIADRLGRKVILLISAGWMCFGLAILGAYFYMTDTGHDASKISWLPLPALIIFIFAFNIGFGAIPWVILSEICGNDVKAMTASICTSLCWGVGFILTLMFPFIETVGHHYAFWIFSTCCAFGFVFTLVAVMETRGLSLQEIQEKLHKKNSRFFF